MVMFGVEVRSGSERAAILRFEQFPAFAHDRLLAALWRIERRLETAVRAAQPARTGQLRSLTGGRVYDHGSRIAAVIGVRANNADDALKAAALEYGSARALMVRAHQAKLSHLWGRAMTPMTVQRESHLRRTNLSPHRFLRGPMAAIRADAIAEMKVAVEDAAHVASR
jgi:hypothetical protein